MTSTAVNLNEHLSLVVALTKVNSEHLIAMGRRGGAEIELIRALEDLAASSGDADDEVPNMSSHCEAGSPRTRKTHCSPWSRSAPGSATLARSAGPRQAPELQHSNGVSPT